MYIYAVKSPTTKVAIDETSVTYRIFLKSIISIFLSYILCNTIIMCKVKFLNLKRKEFQFMMCHIK